MPVLPHPFFFAQRTPGSPASLSRQGALAQGASPRGPLSAAAARLDDAALRARLREKIENDPNLSPDEKRQELAALQAPPPAPAGVAGPPGPLSALTASTPSANIMRSFVPEALVGAFAPPLPSPVPGVEEATPRVSETNLNLAFEEAERRRRASLGVDPMDAFRQGPAAGPLGALAPEVAAAGIPPVAPPTLPYQGPPAPAPPTLPYQGPPAPAPPPLTPRALPSPGPPMPETMRRPVKNMPGDIRGLYPHMRPDLQADMRALAESEAHPGAYPAHISARTPGTPEYYYGPRGGGYGLDPAEAGRAARQKEIDMARWVTRGAPEPEPERRPATAFQPEVLEEIIRRQGREKLARDDPQSRERIHREEQQRLRERGQATVLGEWWGKDTPAQKLRRTEEGTRQAEAEGRQVQVAAETAQVQLQQAGAERAQEILRAATPEKAEQLLFGMAQATPDERAATLQGIASELSQQAVNETDPARAEQLRAAAAAISQQATSAMGLEPEMEPAPEGTLEYVARILRQILSGGRAGQEPMRVGGYRPRQAGAGMGLKPSPANEPLASVSRLGVPSEAGAAAGSAGLAAGRAAAQWMRGGAAPAQGPLGAMMAPASDAVLRGALVAVGAANPNNPTDEEVKRAEDLLRRKGMTGY